MKYVEFFILIEYNEKKCSISAYEKSGIHGEEVKGSAHYIFVCC